MEYTVPTRYLGGKLNEYGPVNTESPIATESLLGTLVIVRYKGLFPSQLTVPDVPVLFIMAFTLIFTFSKLITWLKFSLVFTTIPTRLRSEFKTPILSFTPCLEP